MMKIMTMRAAPRANKAKGSKHTTSKASKGSNGSKGSKGSMGYKGSNASKGSKGNKTMHVISGGKGKGKGMQKGYVKGKGKAMGKCNTKDKAHSMFIWPLIHMQHLMETSMVLNMIYIPLPGAQAQVQRLQALVQQGLPSGLQGCLAEGLAC